MGRKGRVACTHPGIGRRYTRRAANLLCSLTHWDCLLFPQQCLILLSTPLPHPTLPLLLPLMLPTITLHISSPWTPSQTSPMMPAQSAPAVAAAMGITSFCCVCFVFLTWHDPGTSSKTFNRTLLPHISHFLVNHYLWGLLL